jgi:ligand-binding SRPBCC domain-containing protein
MTRPVFVETDIDIARPRAEVAAYATDPDNAMAWYRNIKAVEWESTPPLVVGSRIAFVATFLGRGLAYTYVVRELVPGERFVMSTEEGPFPMETTYTWADLPGGGTRMTLQNRGQPRPFAGLTAPMIERSMRRSNRGDLRRLKEILEKRPPVSAN